MEITGSQIVIECLKEQGVDTIFGYPGGAVLPLYEALYQNQDSIHHILVSHEQGAAHAADGYARSTGKIGVCFATSGPGATNLVTGIATAYMDSVPLIAVTGNVSTSMLGRDSFQEVSITNITMPITKHGFIVRDIKELADDFRQAFYIAQEGRPGPVIIDIPKDVMTGRWWFEPIEPEPIEPVVSRLKDTQLEKAAKMLSLAEKPILFIGGGVIRANASSELREFADQIDAPVVSSLMGMGAFPSSNSRYCGMLGMHGSQVANTIVNQCDLLIAVGVRFSDRVIGKASMFANHAKILQIDVDPAEFGKNVPSNLSVIGDVKPILTKLKGLLSGEKLDHAVWMDQVKKMKEQHPINAAMESKRAREIIEAVESCCSPEETFVTTDVGQHQMWAAQYLHHEYPRHFITSGGLGTMGFGVGASVGTQIGNPGKQVICITGDGSFRMNCNELGTIARYQLPIVILLFDNHVLGMVREWQTLFYDKHYSATTLDTPVDWVKLAEAYGLNGMRLGLKDDAKEIIRKAVEMHKPVVVDCEIPPDDKVYPIIPPGSPSIDMMGIK